MKAWLKNKFGRIVSGASGLLLMVESFDISTIRAPLEGLFPKHGHQIVLGFAGGCAIASFLRHQYVANQHPAPIVLPPPAVKVLLLFSLLALAVASTLVTAATPVEVAIEKNAPAIEGHPLTSVVVTQCNLIVAVYITMPDGRLLRFDKTTQVPSDQLMTIAYSAVRSERVEVSCGESGAIGYERHNPV